jgi:hypothetical protein
MLGPGADTYGMEVVVSYSKSKKVEKVDPVQAMKERKAKEKAEQSSLSKVREKMEAAAVKLATPLILYTGTPESEFKDKLIAFHGTQQEFDANFMQHNQRQSQSAQMGAGLYATPIKSEAEGYGGFLVECHFPAQTTKLLDLSDTAVTSQLKTAGVKPDQWAAANPRVLVKFGATYYLIKTNSVDFRDG